MHAPDDNDLHGVVSRRELLAAGVGTGAIAHRIKARRLFVKYPGVYAVGRADLTVWGERRAIVLACGEGAVLSHRSAASAWGLRPSGGAMWELTLPGTARRRPHAGVRPYRRRLAEHEVTTLRGVPITTVARTLFELSSVIAIHLERRAIERAVELDLFHLPDLQRILDAQHGRPGAPALARRTARFTGDEIEQQPAQVAAELFDLLDYRSSSGEGGIRTLGGP
jgi:hypothetical protein